VPPMMSGDDGQGVAAGRTWNQACAGEPHDQDQVEACDPLHQSDLESLDRVPVGAHRASQ
jgi:hypothetical protein